MSTKAVDISGPMLAICEALGLPYNETLEINFRPGEVQATFALLNDDGKKYITKEGVVATATRELKVRT